MRLPAISMLLLVRQLVDTRSVSQVSSRCSVFAGGHAERSFLGNERLPRASGNNGEYFARAVDIRRYLLATMGSVLSFPRRRDISLTYLLSGFSHLSLASSLLSFLPAIVSHTSGSYVVVVVVVELSRFLSASSHHLCGTDFVSSSSERPSCEKVPRILKNIAR